MSPLRRIVTHRRSALAIVLTGCALAFLVWRPWQPRANVTAATDERVQIPKSDEKESSPDSLISELRAPTEDDLPSSSQTIQKMQAALEEMESKTVPAEIPAKPTLLGSWRDDFYGKRIFTFSADGTATMTIELDSVGQLIYGPKLKFYIDWKQEDGILKLKMTGGEPKSALAAAKLFGETSEQRIESLDANEMKLRSLDSNKLYVHRRVDSME